MCVLVLVDDAADEPSGRANIGLRSVNEIRILDKKNSVHPCVCVRACVCVCVMCIFSLAVVNS